MSETGGIIVALLVLFALAPIILAIMSRSIILDIVVLGLMAIALFFAVTALFLISFMVWTVALIVALVGRGHAQRNRQHREMMRELRAQREQRLPGTPVRREPRFD